VLKIDNTTNKSDEVKEVIVGMKSNQDAGKTVSRQRFLNMVGMR